MRADIVEDINQDNKTPSSLLHNHFILQMRVNDLRLRKERHFKLVNMFVRILKTQPTKFLSNLVLILLMNFLKKF